MRTSPPGRRRRHTWPAYLLAAGAGIALATPAAAQQPYAQGPLLDIVQGMPAGSWARVNTNSFSDVWAPAGLRPMQKSSNPPPSKIIAAWSSFAWDSNRGDLIIYGGGHANYSGNDVYRWRSRTLQWERAALPSEITYLGSNVYTAIDGVDAAPTSAHTYDNAVFLPLFDRYVNFGGAIYNTGGAYVRRSESDPTVFRRTGPYFADPALAHPDKVGGTTGSHVQRTGPHPEITGARMWENRDLPARLSNQPLPASHVSGCTAYSWESDHQDVVYVGARRTSGGTAMDLFRYEVNDLAQPGLDRMTKVGVYWSSPSAQTTCAFDPVSNTVVKTGSNTSPFFFWDLAAAGSSNREQRVSVSGPVADFTAWLGAIGRDIRHCALDYDPVRRHFLVWCGAGTVWSLRPPNPLSLSGWDMTRHDAAGATVPPNLVGTGLLGKWEYIPGFDVFVGLQDSTQGNVWVYKPAGWVAPSDPGGGGEEPPPPPPPSNVAPSVSLTAPSSGAIVPAGSTVTVTATASDSDGTISQVVLRVNDAAIAIGNQSPFSASWTPTATGSYTLTAVATDDKGASTTSAAVSVTVTQPTDQSFATLRRGVDGYAGAADTYLSSYHKTSNFGAKTEMLFNAANYVPLLRFAVFNAEGGPVPDGAVIESAQLHVYKGSYDNVIALHAMQRPWEERQATWAQARSGEPWTVAGAGGVGTDYRATPDAQVSAPFSSGWVVFDVTDRVRSYLAGTANHGWRLVQVSGNGNLKRLRTSEYLDNVTTRPTLEVTWSVPAD